MEISKTEYEPYAKQRDNIKKTARFYFDMLNTPKVKATMGKAMLLAGYSKSSSTAYVGWMRKHPAFKLEMERLKMSTVAYEDVLESIRQKTALELNRRNMAKEKTKDVKDVLQVTDERLRLLQGKSTQNISIGAIIAEIEANDSQKPSQVKEIDES